MLKKQRQKKITLQDLANTVTDLSVTVDDLAIITGKGFAEMREDFRELNSKVSNIETELHEFREEFNDRTGTLEHVVYIEHRGRLEKLEKTEKA